MTGTTYTQLEGACQDAVTPMVHTCIVLIGDGGAGESYLTGHVLLKWPPLTSSCIPDDTGWSWSLNFERSNGLCVPDTPGLRLSMETPSSSISDGQHIQPSVHSSPEAGEEQMKCKTCKRGLSPHAGQSLTLTATSTALQTSHAGGSTAAQGLHGGMALRTPSCRNMSLAQVTGAGSV